MVPKTSIDLATLKGCKRIPSLLSADCRVPFRIRSSAVSWIVGVPVSAFSSVLVIDPPAPTVTLVPAKVELKLTIPPEVTAFWIVIFPLAVPVMFPVGAPIVDPKVNTPPEAVKVTFPPEFTAPSRVTEVVAVPVIFPPAVKVPAALVTNAPPPALAVNVVSADTA